MPLAPLVAFAFALQSGPPPPPRTIRMAPAVVIDATGFEKPMAAATLFVPHGWRTEGGVQWGQEFLCTNGYAFRWSATSPDGATRVAILPQERWDWNNFGAPASAPGCSLAPWTNARAYLEALVARVEPGARVTGFAPREDIRKDYLHLESRTPMPMGESRTWVEAGEVRFTRRDEKGERVGTIAALVTFSLLRSDPGLGTGFMDAISAATFPIWYTAAPAKQHDAALYEAVRRSIQVDPGWDRRISGHNTAIARVALEEGRKRAAMIAQSNEEIARIRSEAWNAYQVSADRRARDFGEALRGVQTYRDADAAGGTVELSNRFDHAWRLTDGSYVLSNDAGFDPWRDLKVEGKKLDLDRR